MVVVVVEMVVVVIGMELSKVGFLCSYPQFQCFRQIHVSLGACLGDHLGNVCGMYGALSWACLWHV